jgi:hypothetical protein
MAPKFIFFSGPNTLLSVPSSTENTEIDVQTQFDMKLQYS